MGHDGFRADHAPDLKILFLHPVHDGAQRQERAENAVVGEKNVCCVVRAAFEEQELPCSEIQSGIGARMDSRRDRSGWVRELVPQELGCGIREA